MTNSILTTKAFHAELIAKRAKYLQKEEGCESMIIDSTSKLSGMELAHSILEKRYLADEVSINQVTTSRAEIETERQKLEEVKRLCNLASAAIKEINVQIQEAAHSIAKARRDFCHSRRDEILSSIQNDNKLKEKLLEAIAAFALNGHDHYTSDCQAFINWFVHQILPKATPEEIKESIAKFSKTHNLPY